MTFSANTFFFRGLLVVVALAPLPLGGNRPWAWSLLAVVLGLLAGGWSLLVIAGRCRAPLPAGRLLTAGVPFGLALLWGALQTSGLTPADTWNPLWSEAATVLGTSANGGMISAAPNATWDAIMRLSCYAAVFLLAAQLTVERARAHEGLVAMVVIGLVYAGYGLAIYFSGAEEILWLKKWAYIGDLTSTFVNRNAYGAYAGLGLICCIAMFAQKLRQRRDDRRGAAEWTETLLVRAMPYLAAALLIGAALLLSHSRGAFVSGGLGILTLMVALTAGRVLPPGAAMRIGVAVAAVGVVAVFVSGERTLERFVETNNESPLHPYDSRPDVYRLTLGAIADAPLTGHGLGAFQPAFRMYRDSTLLGPADWQYAHNIFLETTMDLGVPAALALLGSLAAITGTCARGLFHRRRDQVYPATALAAATLLGVHGVADFSAQIPAIAITLAFLLGIGFAQSWSSRPSPQKGGGHE